MAREMLMFGCVGLAGGASLASAQAQNAPDLQAAVTAAAQQTKAAAFLDVQGCGLSFAATSGTADRATKVASTIEMPLRLGSVGKLYTAAVIHRLAARGVLDLDAPASRYLVAQDAVGVAGRDATLRQLLNHTGGVPDYYALPDIRRWNWHEPLTPVRVLTAIKGRAATGAPGVAYSYSNSGYQLLALVAERATNQSFASLMQAELIIPLNLRETRYNVNAPGGPLHVCRQQGLVGIGGELGTGRGRNSHARGHAPVSARIVHRCRADAVHRTGDVRTPGRNRQASAAGRCRSGG